MSFTIWLEQNTWILYHGSNSDKMTGGLRIGQRDSGWYGKGFYLTAYPEFAKRWGKYIHRMSVPQGKYAEILIQGNKTTYLGDAEKANQEAGGTEAWIDNEDAWSTAFTNSLRKMGYDGVRVHEGEYKDVEVVVFNPATIAVLEPHVA